MTHGRGELSFTNANVDYARRAYVETNGDQTPAPVDDSFTHELDTMQYVNGQRPAYQEPDAEK
jgi:hypothetical protein